MRGATKQATSASSAAGREHDAAKKGTAAGKRGGKMSNRNYLKGVSREYDLIIELKGQGFVAGRNAGSHGAFDVWAMKGGEVMLFQVKKRGVPVTREEKRRMDEFAEKAGFPIVVVFR